MRILFGIESYYPNISGVSVFVKRTAEFIKRRGIEPIILTTNPDGLPEKEETGGFEVFRLKGQKNPFRRNLRVSSIFNHKKVKEILRSTSPSVVHLQDLGPINYLLLYEAKKAGIPIIAHHHFSISFVLGYFKKILGIQMIVGAFIRSVGRNFYNRCRMVITPTEFVKNELLSWGVTVPIEVISNGVETDRFCPPDFYSEKKIVLYVGRIDRDKNIETLARSVPLVLREIPEAEFWFVGDGALRQRAQQMLQKEVESGRVVFWGFIPREEDRFVRIYQRASLIWIASVEAQSIVALEGMATGLPVVAANKGALPELVKDGVNGFLVDISDSHGFAEAVIKILKDRDMALRFRDAGIETAKGHSMDKSIGRLIKSYEGVVSGGAD